MSVSFVSFNLHFEKSSGKSMCKWRKNSAKILQTFHFERSLLILSDSAPLTWLGNIEEWSGMNDTEAKRKAQHREH